MRALRDIGLSADLAARQPTTAGIIATLAGETLNGRTVGVQLYGQEPNAPLIAFLEGRGAKVDTVAPYIYASAAEDERVSALIRDMAAGRVDAIAFTSSPQVQRLTQVAEKAGLGAALKDGLGRTKVAAIGPVVAKELERFGIRPDATVEPPYAMKPLVAAITRLFEPPPAR